MTILHRIPHDLAAASHALREAAFLQWKCKFDGALRVWVQVAPHERHLTPEHLKALGITRPAKPRDIKVDSLARQKL